MKASEAKAGDLVRILFFGNENSFAAMCCDKPGADEIIWIYKPDDKDYLIGCYLGSHQVGIAKLNHTFTRHKFLIVINDMPKTLAAGADPAGIIGFSSNIVIKRVPS